MVQSKAGTVAQYLEELPEERRAVVAAVRDLVLEHLPEGYRESMNWGMIAYEIPLERYPVTYNKQPLAYVALAAQKNYYSLYLMSCYESSEGENRLREEFRKAGKKLDDLPLEKIGEIVAATPPEGLIEQYEASRRK